MSQIPPMDQWRTIQGNAIAGHDYIDSQADLAFHYLHGNGFCGASLEPLARSIDHHLPFPASHLLTDIPGHGHSPQPELYRQPDWNAMADAIAQSVTQRCDRPMIGVGHSLGGVLTLLMAAENPSLFQRVVLLDPVIFLPYLVFAQRCLRKTGLWKQTKLVKQVGQRQNQWSDRQLAADSLSPKRLYREWDTQAFAQFVSQAIVDCQDGTVRLACDPAWEASIFASYPRQLWKLIKQVQVPVQIVVAQKTYGFIPPSAAKASRINPNISVSKFGRDHVFPMTDPQQAAQHIMPFILDLD